MLASLANGVLLSVVGPTVPAIAARLHVRESDMGVVFGANFLIAALFDPVAGRLYDLVGPRIMLPLGLICMALGALGEGLAPTLPLLALAAVVGGLGIGINTVTNNVTPSALYPERRESVLNILTALFGTGAFLAPLAASFSLVHLGGYAPAYIATAVLLAVPAVLLAVGLPAGRPEGAEHSAHLRELLAVRALWAYGAISFLYLGAEIGFGGWIVVIVHTMAHVSIATASPIAALFWLFLAVGGAPTGYLLHRGVAPGRLVALGAGTAVVAALGLALGGTTAGLAAALAALIGLAFAPIFPLTIAGAVRVVATRAPGAVGGATALVLMAGQLGAATVPPLQGLVLRGGTLAAIAVTGACSLAMLLIQRAISRAQS